MSTAFLTSNPLASTSPLNSPEVIDPLPSPSEEVEDVLSVDDADTVLASGLEPGLELEMVVC